MKKKVAQAIPRKEKLELIIIFLALASIPLFDQVLPATSRLTPLMPPILIFAIIGLGLTVVTGFTGQLHLGVSAFVAIGAYTFSIISSPIYPFQFGFWISLLISALLGSIAGALLAIPTLRLRGDYLAIVTLGFGEIVQDVLRNLDLITKGTQGINPVPSPTLFGISITSDRYYLWFFLVLTLLAILTYIITRLEDSYVGRSWMALRDDELASSAMGIEPVHCKLTAFSLGAALAAMGGALMAALLGSSGEPSNYDFQVSIIALSTVIVGGIGSVPGAIVGAVTMMSLNSIALPRLAQLFSASSNGSTILNPANWKYLIFGAALVIMMRCKRDGLLPPVHKRQQA